MWKAIEFMNGKIIKDKNIREWLDGDFAHGVEFTDGTRVVCKSAWSGPYSELTPDVDADPPIFYIFEREK